MIAVLRRPSLWPTAAVQARRLVPRGWWRRSPFLPVPSRGYYRFRMETQYGDPAHRPAPDDLVTYLHWCRLWNRAARGRK
jgi:hypothetical protein